MAPIPAGGARTEGAETISVRSLRLWLKRNKIFFETLAQVLLALMAIVVAMAQWSVRKGQLRLAEAQNQPLLLWQQHGDHYLLINEGQRASSFNLQLAVVVRVSASVHDRSSSSRSVSRKVILPEMLYWPENRASGTLLSFPVASLSPWPVTELEEAFWALREEDWPSNLRQPRRFRAEVFARVSFVDIMSEARSQYFLMEPSLEFPKLDDLEGRRYFEFIENLETLEVSAEVGSELRALIQTLADLAEQEVLTEALSRYNRAGPQ